MEKYVSKEFVVYVCVGHEPFNCVFPFAYTVI